MNQHEAQMISILDLDNLDVKIKLFLNSADHYFYFYFHANQCLDID